MSWQQTEFILKGIYLGLLVFIGLQLPAQGWLEIGQVALCTFGGLALCLGIAAVRKLREGYRVRGRLPAFVLFLLLENPGLVYAGVLLGMSLGAFSIRKEDQDSWLLVYTVGGGAVLGYVFWLLVHVRDRKTRLWLGLALAVALVGGAIAAFHFQQADQLLNQQRVMIGTLLLLGIPVFYLLALASMVEETEVEIAAVCAALGIGLWLVGERLSDNPQTFQTIALALPLVLYFFYTRRVLPGLRVFKHVLRGMSYASIGQYRPALLSLNRAIQLDPDNDLARETLWKVHRQMDLNQVVNDPEILALVNFEMCLERVAWLLLLRGPRPEHLAEAHRLLDLVSGQRPAMQARCDYWRAVALTHQRRYDEAAAALQSVLEKTTTPQEDPHRWLVLMSAWQLALLLHPEMLHRVGTPLLAKPGRRVEAIAAVERRLAASADDAEAWDLKRLLYNDLTEAEYRQSVDPERPPKYFDHEYARQLGLALIEDAARWERGAEYLRVAAHGLPANGPSLYFQIAKAHERAGHNKAVWDNYERAKQVGLAAGHKNLSAEDRTLFFGLVKALAEDHMKHGEVERAIEDFRLYTEYERAGLETYRTLAELYQRKGDSWSALHCTEQALVYDARDKDLLERKDRYYYSVTPGELQERLENVRKWFDVTYCTNKARWVLDKGGDDLELLDWADHLTQLAQIVQPASLAVRVLRARVLRRRGEVEKALALLEDVRTNKPEKFPSTEEEDAWFLACRLLGDLYLHEKPELAVECFQEYRKSPRSGADTSYKLGVAYENLGDHARAVKCYQQVVAFESHPLAPEAHEALQRLKAPR